MNEILFILVNYILLKYSHILNYSLPLVVFILYIKTELSSWSRNYFAYKARHSDLLQFADLTANLCIAYLIM